MKINTYQPSELLRPFIRTYLIIESDVEVVNRVLPDSAPVLAFRYKGGVKYIGDNIQTELPAAIVSGLRKSVRLINYDKDTGNVLVVFMRQGHQHFLKTRFMNCLKEVFRLIISYQLTCCY